MDIMSQFWDAGGILACVSSRPYYPVLRVICCWPWLFRRIRAAAASHWRHCSRPRPAKDRCRFKNKIFNKSIAYKGERRGCSARPHFWTSTNCRGQIMRNKAALKFDPRLASPCAWLLRLTLTRTHGQPCRKCGVNMARPSSNCEAVKSDGCQISPSAAWINC